MRNVLLSAALSMLLVPCLAEAKLTKAQKQAIKQAVQIYDSRFFIPNELADLAWGRATEWVTLLSEMRLDVATDTVLQTYQSDKASSMELACQVNRRKDALDTVFTADCGINNFLAIGETRRGSTMLRRYIMTGEEECLVDGSSRGDAAACLLWCSDGGQSCEPKEPELIFPEVEASAFGTCSVEQISAMAKTGLSDEQIKAACGTG